MALNGDVVVVTATVVPVHGTAGARYVQAARVRLTSNVETRWVTRIVHASLMGPDVAIGDSPIATWSDTSLLEEGVDLVVAFFESIHGALLTEHDAIHDGIHDRTDF